MENFLKMYIGDSSDKIVAKISNVHGYYITMDETWTCTLNVYQDANDSNVLVLEKELSLSTDSSYFYGEITPQESLQLASGRYEVVVQLSNSSLNFIQTQRLPMDVLELLPS